MAKLVSRRRLPPSGTYVRTTSLYLALVLAACVAPGPGTDAGSDVASTADADGGLRDATEPYTDAEAPDSGAELDAPRPDGGSPGCDPRADDALCECTDDNGRSVIPGMLGPHVYCCDERDGRPWACADGVRGATHLYWVDMSRFGAFCGGRDFPFEHALSACPWEE